MYACTYSYMQDLKHIVRNTCLYVFFKALYTCMHVPKRAPLSTPKQHTQTHCWFRAVIMTRSFSARTRVHEKRQTNIDRAQSTCVHKHATSTYIDTCTWLVQGRHRDGHRAAHRNSGDDIQQMERLLGGAPAREDDGTGGNLASLLREAGVWKDRGERREDRGDSGTLEQALRLLSSRA
jgi:hypothetical protein